MDVAKQIQRAVAVADRIAQGKQNGPEKWSCDFDFRVWGWRSPGSLRHCCGHLLFLVLLSCFSPVGDGCWRDITSTQPLWQQQSCRQHCASPVWPLSMLNHVCSVLIIFRVFICLLKSVWIACCWGISLEAGVAGGYWTPQGSVLEQERPLWFPLRSWHAHTSYTNIGVSCF